MKKNSKGFVVFGLLALSVILVIGIFTLTRSPVSEDILHNTGENTKEVTPGGIDGRGSVIPGSINGGANNSYTQPEQSGDPNEIILTRIEDKSEEQPDPPETAHKDNQSKKTTDSALTNPDVKPNSSPKPAETQKEAPANPSGGKPGQVWLDGFGWVTPSTPQGEQSSSDGDWDKIIGH